MRGRDLTDPTRHLTESINADDGKLAFSLGNYDIILLQFVAQTRQNFCAHTTMRCEGTL